MITIGGNTAPLNFQLNDVNITTNGSVRSSSGNNLYNNWSEWIEGDYYYNTGTYGIMHQVKHGNLPII